MNEEFEGYYCQKCKLMIGEPYIKWITANGIIQIPVCMKCKTELEIKFRISDKDTQ